MLRWLKISYWRQRLALIRHREQLALLLWPFLSARERSEDDAAPLQLLARVVRALEAGREDFPDDAPAQALWQQARSDHQVTQASTSLQILRQQLEVRGSPGVKLDPVGKKQLKQLRRRTKTDRLAENNQWLHAPLTLPLISTLFLFSGWLYNTIFFSHFDVPVGRYFGLGDYLAASIDGLIQLAAAVGVGIIIQFVSGTRFRLKALQNHLGATWQQAGESALGFGVLIAGLLILDDFPMQGLFLTYTLMVAVPMTLLLPLLLGRSRRPVRDTMLLSVVTVYLAAIWVMAEMRFANLEARPVSSEITMISAPDTSLPWRVISGNSLYLFLLNEQHEVVAVPVQQVLSVRYMAEQADEAAESE